MAEIALGGIQISVRSTRSGECAHTETLSTISSGVERVVCESCGKLSIQFHSTLRGPILREMFARPADDLEPRTGLNGTVAHTAPKLTVTYGFEPEKSEKTRFVAHRPQATALRNHSWARAV